MLALFDQEERSKADKADHFRHLPAGPGMAQVEVERWITADIPELKVHLNVARGTGPVRDIIPGPYSVLVGYDHDADATSEPVTFSVDFLPGHRYTFYLKQLARNPITDSVSFTFSYRDGPTP